MDEQEPVESKLTSELKYTIYGCNAVIQLFLVLLMGNTALDSKVASKLEISMSELTRQEIFNQIVLWSIWISVGLLSSLLTGFLARIVTFGSPWPLRLYAILDHFVETVWRRHTWEDFLTGLPRTDLVFHALSLFILEHWFHAPLRLLSIVGGIRCIAMLVLEFQPVWMLRLVPLSIEQPGHDLDS